ncbi:hypothetical protein ACIHCQ_30985 [Streptomyces sp. NPDC052236]|uniref:hypothetical protein n=1 Tax=Streptomyces sp. NPDC052236 TaxID=3365686 RepID=UPI0037CE03DD
MTDAGVAQALFGNTARDALALADDIGEGNVLIHLDTYFSWAVVAPGLPNGLAGWRNLWSGGEDLARHARGFIAHQLATNGRPS